MKNFIKKSIIGLFVGVFAGINLFSPAKADKENDLYDQTLDTIQIQASESNIKDEGGVDPIVEMITYLVDIVINLLIFVGVAVAMFGGYKIMSSSDEKAIHEGITLVGAGIVGILVMVSAKFISATIFETLQGDVEGGLEGIDLAKDLYNNLLYPFIKIVLYFVVGILFFVMAAKIIGFMTSTDDGAKKKAAGIIIWTIVGILVILGSKQMVETVMGKQSEVLQGPEIRDMGLGILEIEYDNIPIVYNVMNWIMGLSMFIVLVLIIVQSYRMIAKPDDPKNRETMKKTILYVVIGVLVIGATYVISNVLVVA